MGCRGTTTVARADEADARKSLSLPVEVFRVWHVASQVINSVGSIRIDASHRSIAQAHRPCPLRKAVPLVHVNTGERPTGGAPRTEAAKNFPVRTAVLDQDAEYSVNRRAFETAG